MKLENLVIVILRLIALHAVLQVITHVGPQVFYVLTLMQGAGGFSAWNFAANSLGSAVMIAGGAALWAFAEPLARSVTRGVTGEEFSVGSLTLVDAYSLAFVIVGLFYVIAGIPEVVTRSHFALRSETFTQAAIRGPQSDPLNGYYLATASLRFFLGIALLLNARNWAIRLARRHHAIKDAEHP